MTRRPVTLATSAVLVAIIGLSIAAVGAILLALAGGGLADLGLRGIASTALPLTGAAMVVAGISAIGAAAGLWLGYPWAWAASLVVALVAVWGAFAALATAGFQLPLAVGLVLTAAATSLLLAPSTRSAVGVG